MNDWINRPLKTNVCSSYLLFAYPPEKCSAAVFTLLQNSALEHQPIGYVAKVCIIFHFANIFAKKISFFFKISFKTPRTPPHAQE